MIRLDNLTKSYSQAAKPAVLNLSLHVKEKEFLVLIGASGSGKTTALKMINRLIEKSSGSVNIGGVDTSDVDPVHLRRSIGYVFQGVGLFPHMTVAENISAIPHLLGWEKDRILARVDELLMMVGLLSTEFSDRFPHQLSGGQQQRVGVARALAAKPKVMLMDEPFGALDPLSRDKLQTEFSRLHRQLGLTVVMVTHDMTEALLMADRIAVMSEGEMLQLGTPHELMTNPSGEVVAALIDTPKRQADRLEALAHKNSTVENEN